MRFQSPLRPARLLRRYKRFLADIRLEDGTEAVAHCPNPGAMTGLAEPGMRIWVERNDDPRRKLRYGWRLTELEDGTLVNIDTSTPNRIVAEALAAGEIPALAAYTTHRAEVRYGRASRADFLLSAPDLPDALVEVKSVTLRRGGRLGEFPDTRTARGARHLAELAAAVGEGRRAVLLYLLGRGDCDEVAVAGDIDPAYAAASDAARAAGVEIIAHSTRIGPEGLTLGPAVPVRPGSGKSRSE